MAGNHATLQFIHYGTPLDFGAKLKSKKNCELEFKSWTFHHEGGETLQHG